MMLTLISLDSTTIAVVEYNSSFYGDDDKAKGGWSLERIDANNLSDNVNWKASTDVSGGTPGRENSAADVNPDILAPYVIKTEMMDEYSILLLFSEMINSSILQNIEYYTVENIGHPSIAEPLTEELSNQVELRFDNSFNIGIIYELSVSTEIKDIHGNRYNGEVLTFGRMETPNKDDIIINEILFQPYLGGADFVEIYNRSDKILDLSDISIANRNKSDGKLQQIHKVTENHIYLHPKDYFVFTTDYTLSQFYYIENPDNIIVMSGFPSYPNEEGTVAILDSETNVIDEFTYSNKMHGVFISNPQGVSLERVDYDRKSAELANWQSSAQTAGFATPTYKNSCYKQTDETDEAFAILPTTFSPDGDGYDDVLFIDYKMPVANCVANISIYSLRGSFVKEICRNMTLGTEGRLTWDGTAANKIKAPIGPYIVYIEAFNADGKVYKYKKVCVVASRK
jgi:hypothetical protein